MRGFGGLPSLGAVAVVAAGVLALVGLARTEAPTGPPHPDMPTHREGYRLALPPYSFAFPRDHAAHPEYRTEWWYYTGHLRAPGVESEPSYGFQLTFFRIGVDTAWRASRSAWAPRELVFAHLALTDVAAQRFRFAERIARPVLGIAGADPATYRVWIDDWSAGLAPDGRGHRLSARSGSTTSAGATTRAEEFGIELDLESLGPPVIHGHGGVSQKSAAPGNASHYYSLTRLRARGHVVTGARRVAVEGLAWMDHEFGTSQLGPDQVGWDWFSLQLDDGRELMLYRLRLRDGTIEPLSSGTLVSRDGAPRHLALADFEVRSEGEWRSPRSGGTYPARWTLGVPGEDLALTVEPVLDDQELVARTAAGAAYWEGLVRVRGSSRGRPVRGHGYVELTGYAGAPLRF